MLDLLSSLIFTPLANTTPPPDVSDLTSCLLTSYACAKSPWRNPHSPLHGHSPLRAEYKAPRAWPNECDSATTSPSMYCDSSTSLSQALSSPSGYPESRSLEYCGTLEAEQGNAADYAPNDAVGLVATALPQTEGDTMKQCRKNEEIHRIRNVLDRKRQWNDGLAFLLGENMLADEIKRHIGAAGVKYALEDEHKMGEGTIGVDGHRRMQVFLHSKERKRKRVVGDKGDEVTKSGNRVKRRRKLPRGILKVHVEKRCQSQGARIAAQ